MILENELESVRVSSFGGSWSSRKLRFYPCTRTVEPDASRGLGHQAPIRSPFASQSLAYFVHHIGMGKGNLSEKG